MQQNDPTMAVMEPPRERKRRGKIGRPRGTVYPVFKEIRLTRIMGEALQKYAEVNGVPMNEAVRKMMLENSQYKAILDALSLTKAHKSA